MGEIVAFSDNSERLYAIAATINPNGFGQTYLSPFVEVMVRLDPERHGIGRHDIIAVKQAFMNCEDWGWEGGFIVELHDGRCAMIDISAQDFDWDNKTKLTIELKPGGFDFLSPDIPADHEVRFYGFVDNLPEIELFLRRLAACCAPVIDRSGEVNRLPF